MSRRVHYELQLDECLSQPLCENQAHRDAIADIDRECEMSPYDDEVTCKRCLKALGYEPVPANQLTECLPDPFAGRLAA